MGNCVDLGIIRRRAAIVAAIRSFFDGLGFVEVETPVRIAAPAPEPHIDCPAVQPCSADCPVTYLRASPELQMKRLLAAGMDMIYQIGPCFRDGERGTRHNPEFTMIEWYRKCEDYLAILSDMEALFQRLYSLFAKDGASPDNPLKFSRITVREAYLRWAGWDPWLSWDQDRFDLDMAVKVEPALKGEGCVFLMDYPPQAASLARIRGDVAERWEFYVNGVELANCFTELCDPAEQRRRFDDAREERRRIGEADYPLDEAFLSELDAIGSAAGVAVGVDRLVMALLGATSIDQVRLI